MRKYLIAAALLVILYITTSPLPGDEAVNREGAVERAYEAQRSGGRVTGEGVIGRILPDDDEGSRHQRFVVRVATGQTVLIAHNIDVAPRVAALQVGDSVAFNGIYEWNEQGGVVHWTHHDPRGERQGGWLRHAGVIYK